MTIVVLIAHHLTAPTLTIGFALLLVATLVAAEERDLRRVGAKAADRPRG